MAQSRAGDQQAVADFASNAARLKERTWPYPLVELFLGEQEAGQVIATANSPGERCEANFYIGEWHLMKGREQDAIRMLQTAAEMCPKNFVEYSGAVAELTRFEAELAIARVDRAKIRYARKKTTDVKKTIRPTRALPHSEYLIARGADPTTIRTANRSGTGRDYETTIGIDSRGRTVGAYTNSRGKRVFYRIR